MTQLPLALLGAGSWGKNLVRAFRATPRVDLRLVVDPAREARRRIAEHGIATAADARAAFEDPTIEAVAIATPAATHAELTCAALAHGKHVFVEKPLCLSLDEGERIRDAALCSGRTVMVGHLLLYHPAMDKLRSLVDTGELGAIRYLYSTRVNLGYVRRQENAWWSLAPHDVSMILALVATAPVRVVARGAAYLTPSIEDVVFAHIDFADGVTAAIHVSWLDPHKRRQLTVVGARRMVTFDDIESSEKVRIFDVGAEVKTDFDSFAELVLLRHGDITIPRLAPLEPLQVELAHFASAVLDGSRPRTGIDEGLAVVRVLEAGQRSLERGGAAIEL